ncbi:MAG: RsmE family RNA methyltransferase [SAR324 cluster bacterium]|nr:RsmE family RNA methyltransferase [SAR324 cluster bacterium]
MSYFLTENQLKLLEPFELKGEEAGHILLSRRMRVTEQLEIQDQNGQRYVCEITELQRKSLVLKPLNKAEIPLEPLLGLILYQSLVKEKALDFIIQKACELGAAKIILFQSQNSQKLPQSQYKGKTQDKAQHQGEAEKRLGRWNKIALEAAKQSGRLKPLEIQLLEALPLDLPPEATLVFDTSGERKSLKDLNLPKTNLNLILGPEGGFSKGELPDTYPAYHLGPRILRADTAALAVLSILQFSLGDMG